MTFRETADLKLALDERCTVPVDVVDLQTHDAILRFEVVSAAVVLYADTRARWTDFVARTLIDHDDLAPFIDDLVAGVARRAARGVGA